MSCVESELIWASWLPVSVGADVMPEDLGDWGWFCCGVGGRGKVCVVGFHGCVVCVVSGGGCLCVMWCGHVEVIIVLQVFVY